MPYRTETEPARVALGVLIRFKNSAKTLPGVLAALKAQSLQPNLILGVDSGSTDGSAELLRAAGAQVIGWSGIYHHSKVLNFGLARCPAERVLVLSSHTVLQSPDALAKLNAALDDPKTACVSARWSEDDFYSDAITWEELRGKGLKLASIYSNSFGLLRRRLWEELPFDESVPTMEDYVWAVAQVRRGYTCRRVDFQFSYQRQVHARDFIFSACAFRLAAQHGLKMRWLGAGESTRRMLKLAWAQIQNRALPEQAAELRMHRDRVLGSALWRFTRAKNDT